MFITDKSSLPIGIFDSGLGGLTVASALMSLMPNENIIYFGDTGRVPYGTRSEEVIRSYAAQDAEFLLSKNVKMVVAACGTVSSVAPDIGKKLPVPFVGVVEPAAKAAAKASRNGKIGVAGTSATVRSRSFVKSINRINPELSVFQQSCPLFVNIVEEGYTDPSDPIAKLIVERYLSDIKDSGIDTLILGCTHFPLLSKVIGEFMGDDVVLISTGDAAAKQIRDDLNEKGLINKEEKPGHAEFFVSDRTEGFSRIAGAFLGNKISDNVSQVDWGDI